MVLVPANMSRFDFSPCNLFMLFLVHGNMSHFVFGPWPHFCDDFHTWHM